MADAGLTYNAGKLSVGVSGLGLSVGADAITLTSSSNPGAAASILASNASGGLVLQRLGIGAAMTLFSTNNAGTGPDISFDGSGLLAAAVSLNINLDSDNNSTDAALIIRRDAQTTAGAEIFRFAEDGTATITGKVRTPAIDTASGNLTITPVGDLVLNPGDSSVLPGGSIEDDLGDYNRKWRTLFAAELYVETLVAQDVLSTIGGRVEVTPTTTLIADLAAGAAAIYVKHNNLRNGEYAYLMAAPGGIAQFEVIRVTSGASAVTGGYTYSVTRNLDGTGANNWVAGDAVASLAKDVGEGHISLTATSTVYNHLGPTVAIYSRTATNAWNAVAPVVAQGNLRSFVDYSTTAMGLAIGNDLIKTPTTGFQGLTADATNGLRMFSTAISAYNGATQTFYLAPTGLNMWIGPSSADKRLTWDGLTLGVVGSVTATAGYIGGASGWAITSGKLASANIALYSGDVYTARLELGNGTAAWTAGVHAVNTAGDTAFWAGAAADDTLNAKYRVTAGGSLYSTDATFGSSLKVDGTGAYIPAPSSFNLDYGYKFRYGTNNGAGLAAWYVANSATTLYLLNNMAATSNSIVDSIADSTLIIAGAAGAAKTSQVSLIAKRVVGGVDDLAALTIINTSSAKTLSFMGAKVWHENNDGPGSGLDADLFDGMDSSLLAQLNSPTFTGTPVMPTLQIPNNTTATGSRHIDIGRYQNVTNSTSIGTPDAKYIRLFVYEDNSGKLRLAVSWPGASRRVSDIVSEPA